MPRTYSTIAISAGSGTNVDTVQTSADSDHRQVMVLGDPDTDTQLLAIDANGRAAVAVVATVLAGSTTNVPVGTPTNTSALDVSKAGACTFIVKNTVAASPWAGAPVMVFEQSDDSTSWAQISVVRSDNNASGSTFTLGAGVANAEIMFDAALEGVNWVRCRCTTAPTTNALTIVIQPGGGFFSPQVIAMPPPSVTGTPTSVAANASVVTLLAANTNRLGYTVFNDSTATMYLLNGSGASLTAYSLQIPSNGYYECPYMAGRGYQGIVTALWSAATGAARLVEHS